MLQNINFTRIIDDIEKAVSLRAENFTGREWVFEIIDAWLASEPGKRYFLIRGEPGCGKSAIAARLWQISQGAAAAPQNCPALQPGLVSAVHFISARDQRSYDPNHFVESVALQLARRFPAFNEALIQASSTSEKQIQITTNQTIATNQGNVQGVVIEQLSIESPSERAAFNLAVLGPIEYLLAADPHARVVILVDALDEGLESSGKNPIFDLIANNDQLDLRVRFLVTSRPIEMIQAKLYGPTPSIQEIFLSAPENLPNNEKDIRSFIQSTAAGDVGLAEVIRGAADENPGQDAVENIVQKADGNFQYARFLLTGMKEGDISIRDLEGLPKGLHALYNHSLNRLFSTLATQSVDAWKARFGAILGFLSAAQESLTLAQLAAFSGQPVDPVRDAILLLEQFLDHEPAEEESEKDADRYGLYHASVADFLNLPVIKIDKNVQVKNIFYVARAEYDRKIIEHYKQGARTWNDVDWKRVDDYGLEHISIHIERLKDAPDYRAQINELICKSLLKEKFRRYGSHKRFADDINRAASACLSTDPPDIPGLIRLSLLHAHIVTSTLQIQPEVLWMLVILGQINRALNLAYLQKDASIQAQAYLKMGDALLYYDDHELTIDVLNEAIRLLKATGAEAYPIQTANKLLAEALAKAGRVEEAWNTTELLTSGKVEAQGSVICKTKTVFGLDQALLLLGRLPKAADRLQVLYPVLKCALDDGQISDALKVVEQYADLKDQEEEVWKKLGIAAKMKFDPDQAVALAAEWGQPRAGYFAEGYAQVLAKEGNIAGTLKISGQVSQENRAKLLTEAFYNRVKQQGVSQALDQTSLLSPVDCDRVLAGLAERLAEDRQVADSQTVLGVISTADARREAYSKVFEVLSRAGQVDLLIELIQSGQEDCDHDQAWQQASAAYYRLEEVDETFEALRRMPSADRRAEQMARYIRLEMKRTGAADASQFFDQRVQPEDREAVQALLAGEAAADDWTGLRADQLVERGYTGLGLSLLEGEKEEFPFTYRLKEVIDIYLQAGRLEPAWHTAGKIPFDQYDRADVFGKVLAEWMLREGLGAVDRRLAEFDPIVRPEILFEAGLALLEDESCPAQKVDLAFEIHQKLKGENYYKGHRFEGDLIYGLLVLGRENEAQAVIDDMMDFSRDIFLKDVALKLAGQAHLEQALFLNQQFTKRETRLKVAAEVSRQYLIKDDTERAEAVLEEYLASEEAGLDSTKHDNFNFRAILFTLSLKDLDTVENSLERFPENSLARMRLLEDLAAAYLEKKNIEKSLSYGWKAFEATCQLNYDVQKLTLRRQVMFLSRLRGRQGLHAALEKIYKRLGSLGFFLPDIYEGIHKQEYLDAEQTTKPNGLFHSLQEKRSQQVWEGEVLAVLKKSARLFRRDYLASAIFALGYAEAGQTAHATLLAEHALSLMDHAGDQDNERHVDTLSKVARVWLKIGSPKKAKEVYEKILQIISAEEPHAQKSILLKVIEELAEEGGWELVDQAVERILNGDSGQAEFYDLEDLVKILIDRGQKERARRVADQMMARMKKSPPSSFDFGFGLQAWIHLDDSEGILEILRLMDTTSDITLRVKQIYDALWMLLNANSLDEMAEAKVLLEKYTEAPGRWLVHVGAGSAVAYWRCLSEKPGVMDYLAGALGNARFVSEDTVFQVLDLCLRIWKRQADAQMIRLAIQAVDNVNEMLAA